MISFSYIYTQCLSSFVFVSGDDNLLQIRSPSFLSLFISIYVYSKKINPKPQFSRRNSLWKFFSGGITSKCHLKFPNRSVFLAPNHVFVFTVLFYFSTCLHYCYGRIDISTLNPTQPLERKWTSKIQNRFQSA